jgi:hypothetical protein
MHVAAVNVAHALLQVHYIYTAEQLEQIKAKSIRVAQDEARGSAITSKWPSLHRLQSLAQRGKC